MPKFRPNPPLIHHLIPILINLDAPNHPIRLLERLRMIPHVRFARRRFGRAPGAIGPRLPGPIAAEGRVEHDVQVLEMRVDVARAAEAGHRHAPRARVRVRRRGGRDVGGHVGAGEMEDLDVGARPDGGVDAAADGVHARAEGGTAGHGVADAAAHVFALPLGVDVAVGGLEIAAEAGVLDGAVRGGVEGHFVVGLIVGALEDVNLAALGPGAGVGEQPGGGPGAADARGGVFEVEDEEAVVVGFLGGDTDAGAAAGGVCGGVVDAHVDGGLGGGGVDGDEAVFGGVGEVFVLDEAVGGVGLVVEEEGLEPVGCGVGVGEGVVSVGCGEDRGARGESEEGRTSELHGR